jgi:hypothetical protein
MHRFIEKFRLKIVLIIIIAIPLFLSLGYALYLQRKPIHNFYIPKLLMLRIDDIPFPRNRKAPVEVMGDASAAITCENVNPSAEMGNPLYRINFEGKTTENSACNFKISMVGKVGTTQKIVLEYLLRKPDGMIESIDKWQGTVRSIPAGEYLTIHNFASRDGKAIESLTVPQEVIPNVKAALKLDGEPDEYAVLFFVEAMGTDMPVLQVMAKPQSPNKLEPISAPLKRYRKFGPEVGGYGAWTTDPIRIGDSKDERKIFSVYAGLFKVNELQMVTQQLLSFEGVSDDDKQNYNVKVVPMRLADIQKLAWKGWISKPVRVVRKAELEESPSPESSGI